MNNTDYKKQWKSSQRDNVAYHNKNVELEGAIAFILAVPGVKELVQKSVDSLKKPLPVPVSERMK